MKPLPLLSQAFQQGAGVEVKRLGLELALRYRIPDVGGSYATIPIVFPLFLFKEAYLVEK